MISNLISRRAFLGSSAAAFAFPALAGTGELERFTYRQVHMGMVARITLYARHIDHAKEAARTALGSIQAVDEALSGLDDFVPRLAWLKFILHGLERPTGHVTGITPVLHALLEVTHAITSVSGTAPALITLTSVAPARS